MDEKEPRRPAPTTPEDYPVAAPAAYPSGDYSYTVELVGNIQHQLGKLTEAVEALKVQVQGQGADIKAINRDIHTAKVFVKIAAWILAALLAFGGWAINKAVDAYVSTHSQSSAATSQQKSP